MSAFDEIIDKTFTFEGGYQNFANDTANYNSLQQLAGTNHGISAIAYEQYLKRPPTVADIKAITKDIAKAVYKKLFWDKVQGDQLKNDSVAHIVFDSHIGSGGIGLKQVRQAINKTAGKNVVSIGTNSLTPGEANIINGLNQEQFFNTLKQTRLSFFQYLADSNPSKYGMFLKGWFNRLAKINYSEITEDQKKKF